MNRTPYTTTIADIDLELATLDDELLPADARAALTKTRDQLKSGDYIVLEPDLGGFGFVTHHYPEGAIKSRSLGHTRAQSVVELALRVGQPVVISEALIGPRREMVARKLVLAGVVPVEFEFKPGEEWTS
jgi:hypothetical protein